jgi:hypothetical protein
MGRFESLPLTEPEVKFRVAKTAEAKCAFAHDPGQRFRLDVTRVGFVTLIWNSNLSMTELEPPLTFVPADTEERRLESENVSLPGAWDQTPGTEYPLRSKPLELPLRNVTAVELLSVVEV